MMEPSFNCTLQRMQTLNWDIISSRPGIKAGAPVAALLWMTRRLNRSLQLPSLWNVESPGCSISHFSSSLISPRLWVWQHRAHEPSIRDEVCRTLLSAFTIETTNLFPLRGRRQRGQKWERAKNGLWKERRRVRGACSYHRWEDGSGVGGVSRTKWD